jgi:hypothetical protein
MVWSRPRTADDATRATRTASGDTTTTEYSNASSSGTKPGSTADTAVLTCTVNGRFLHSVTGIETCTEKQEGTRAEEGLSPISYVLEAN